MKSRRTATAMALLASLATAALLLSSSSSTEAFAPPPAAVVRRQTAATSSVFGASSSSLPVPPRGAGSASRGLKMSSAAAAAAGAEGDGEESESSVGGGTSTIPNHIFNLVKSIVGAGVLSLPAGIASFSNAPGGLLPATVLIAAIGAISGYGFSLIGRVCSYTDADSYRDAWSKSVGDESSWIPAWSCTFKTLCAVLAYSMILADTFKSILFTAGVQMSRSNTLFGVTGLVLLPLCLLKNLSSLAPFSLLGIAGMAYTALAMGVRYFGGGYLVPDGQFLADIAPQFVPRFGTTGAMGVLNPNVFILICMLSTSYMAHFNAPKFYTELKNNTIARYNAVVSSSFAISVLFFVVMASLGFLTFGSASSGLILNNYSTKDSLMGLSRVAVALAIVFSYPLAFAGLRDGVLDLLSIPKDKRSNSLLNKVTLAALSGVTALACVVKDLSFVLSFGGATLGNALIYVYPAIMFRSAVKNMGEKATRGLRREVKLALGSAGLGIAMGGIGAKMAVKSLLSG